MFYLNRLNKRKTDDSIRGLIKRNIDNGADLSVSLEELEQFWSIYKKLEKPIMPFVSFYQRDTPLSEILSGLAGRNFVEFNSKTPEYNLLSDLIIIIKEKEDNTCEKTCHHYKNITKY